MVQRGSGRVCRIRDEATQRIRRKKRRREKQTAERGQQEDETLTEHRTANFPQAKEGKPVCQAGGNLRMVKAETIRYPARRVRTRQTEMLLEMSGYWERKRIIWMRWRIRDAALRHMRCRRIFRMQTAFIIMASAAAQDSRTETESPAMRITPITTASGRMANEGNGKWGAFTFIMTMTPRRTRVPRAYSHAGEWKTTCRTVKDRSITRLDMSKAAKSERYIRM